MLVISRKPGEFLTIGDDITIYVLSIGSKLRLGIEAPDHIDVRRAEQPSLADLVESSSKPHDFKSVQEVMDATHEVIAARPGMHVRYPAIALSEGEAPVKPELPDPSMPTPGEIASHAKVWEPSEGSYVPLSAIIAGLQSDVPEHQRMPVEHCAPQLIDYLARAGHPTDRLQDEVVVLGVRLV